MKRLILLLFLLPVMAYCQTTINITDLKKVKVIPQFKISKTDCWLAGLEVVAGFANGLHDAINYHHFGKGIYFIDIDVSWHRKYRNWNAGDYREAFPLSKNVLVDFTDLNHMSRGVEHGCFIVSIVIAKNQNLKDWKQVLIKAVALTLINRGFFELAYNGIGK